MWLLCLSPFILDGLHTDEFSEWGEKGLQNNGPQQEDQVVIATEEGRRGAMHEDSKVEVEVGGEMKSSTVHEMTTSGRREQD